jgi:hypothetical protein
MSTIEAIALNLDLLELVFSRSGQDEDLAQFLWKQARRLYYALDGRGTLKDGEFEDEFGSKGSESRDGRRLQTHVEFLLTYASPDAKTMARNLAYHLSLASGSQVVISRSEPVRLALYRKLFDLDGNISNLSKDPELRRRVARDLVVAAATASGFTQAKKRLFNADRVKRRRQKGKHL